MLTKDAIAAAATMAAATNSCSHGCSAAVTAVARTAAVAATTAAAGPMVGPAMAAKSPISKNAAKKAAKRANRDAAKLLKRGGVPLPPTDLLPAVNKHAAVRSVAATISMLLTRARCPLGTLPTTCASTGS